MPVVLDAGDRKILIVAAVLLVVLTAAAILLARPTQQRAGYPSSYSPASDGAEAAYLVLEESGYDVQRWETSPEMLPGDPHGYVLVVADPLVGASQGERAALTQFVRNGGRILTTSYTGAILLPEDNEIASAPAFDWKSYAPLVPSPISAGVRTIKMQASARWGEKYPSQVALFGDNTGSVVVTYRYGEGEVIWWADYTPLTNAGLREGNDLELLLNSLGPRQGVHVLWDEYFHGQRAGLWSHMRATPAPWILVQLGIVAAFVLVTFGRRNGPVRIPAVEPRLSPLEFVDTVGGLYEQADAASAAVEIAYKRFRYLLARQAGVAVNAKPAAVCAAVRYRTGADEQLLETLRDCELALYDAGFARERGLDLVQRIHHYVAAMRLAPAAEETRG